MERIGTGVLIRSNGNEDFNVVMNGILSQEFQRIREKDFERMEAQRKEFEKKMEWMNMIKKCRDRERNQRLKENYIEIQVEPHYTFKDQVRERVGFILACLICWGEALGFIEIINDKEEWK